MSTFVQAALPVSRTVSWAPPTSGRARTAKPSAPEALTVWGTAVLAASHRCAATRHSSGNLSRSLARGARTTLFEESRLDGGTRSKVLDRSAAGSTKALQGCLVRVQSQLEAPLYADGLWLRRGGDVDGSALHRAGIPARGDATFDFRGEEVLLWHACHKWPFAVATFALRLKDGQLFVSGECSRALPSDARELLSAGILLEPGDVTEIKGLVWKRFPDSLLPSGESFAVVSVIVKGSQFSSLVPVDQESATEELKLPNAEDVLSFFKATFASKARGVRGRWKEIGSPQTPVAERRLFEILGVEPDATAETLRRAWRRRARKLHPDASPEEASAFEALKEAFEVLSEPTQRVRYESLGSAGLRDFEASLEGFTTAVSLVLGAWALRPLLGAVDSPLGLAAATQMDASPEGNSNASPIEVLMSVLDAELRIILDWPEAPEEAEAAELRAALSLQERLKPLACDRDTTTFESRLRSEVRILRAAAAGSLAPELLASWGSAARKAAVGWLAEESQPSSRTPDFLVALTGMPQGQAVPRSFAGAEATDPLLVLGLGLQSLTAIPNVLVSALLSPDSSETRRATQDTVAILLEVAFRSTELQIQRRAARAVRRLLDDEGEPWQLRWRFAHALQFFGRVMQEEGKVDPPDFKAFVASAEPETAKSSEL